MTNNIHNNTYDLIGVFENRDQLWYCIGDRTKKSLLGNIKFNFLE